MFTALGWYFADDYYLGTEAMITWWRTAYKDTKEDCPFRPVRKVFKSVRNQLDDVKEVDNWFFDTQLPKFNDKPFLMTRIGTFFDGFDTLTTGSQVKNYFKVGKECGKVLRDTFDLVITENDC